MRKKILIMGLPGAGKTTLARHLAPRLNAVHYNADDVRANVNRDLGFSESDRVEHARRMGWLCDQVVKAGCFTLADFICPTPRAREAFFEGGPGFVIWMDRIQTGAYEDTNRLFVPPDHYDLRVTANGAPEYWAEQAMELLRPIFDWQRPTALFIGRYQPFHDGHRALIVEASKACRPSLHRGSRHPRDRREQPVRIRIHQGPNRARVTRIRRPICRRCLAEHHQRILWTRRRLRRGAHRPRPIDPGHIGNRFAQAPFSEELDDRASDSLRHRHVRSKFIGAGQQAD
jgi:hypothetical protein